ncbi:MAG TPA: hypothetical protein VF808_17750 [Ktedonobacterales bacterium]
MTGDTVGRTRHCWVSGLGFLLLAALGATIFLSLRAQPASPDIIVTTDHSHPASQSEFAPGVSLVDSTLDPATATQQISSPGETLLRGAATYVNTPIMGWGLPDPWPDPTTPLPTNWSSLDARVKLAIRVGAIPVITLCEAPWWDEKATTIQWRHGDAHAR